MTKFSTDTDLPQNTDQGPLASIIPVYAALLSQQGYSQQYARFQLRFLADLNQWLQRHRLQISDLTESTLRRYLRCRHQRFRRSRGETWIVRRLLNLLHTQGLLAKRVPPLLDDPHQTTLNDFDRYLSEERGLSMVTRLYYRPFIQQFLSVQFGDKPIRFVDLNAEDVIRFIRNQARASKPQAGGTDGHRPPLLFSLPAASRRYHQRSGGLCPFHCELATLILAEVPSTSPGSAGLGPL